MRWLTADTRSGWRAGFAVGPTFLAIFAGFGIASQATQVPELAAVLATLLVFAAPAQFAMVDLASQGGTLAQVIAIGVLVNLRFVLMSLTLATRFQGVSRWRLAFWAQFVSASSYLLTFFQSRRPEPGNLHDYYRGVVLVTFPAALLGTLGGLALGVGLPDIVAFGGTLFLPIYFALLLASEVRGRYEIGAVLIGLLLTPPLEALAPGWGLFIAAIAAGGLLRSIEGWA
ncbi:MAG: AzlC family ABC transporter permease [Gammaproteobacteria bacterium]|jgi:predicted branched-subunit amino acid permease|nr:AzlC family ABC transporter permease [Gammaproteobacteria bacterium]